MIDFILAQPFLSFFLFLIILAIINFISETIKKYDANVKFKTELAQKEKDINDKLNKLESEKKVFESYINDQKLALDILSKERRKASHG